MGIRDWFRRRKQSSLQLPAKITKAEDLIAWSMSHPEFRTAMLRMFQSEFKSLPLSALVSRSKTGTPIFPDWTAQRAIREGLKVSSWVYACIYLIAKSASQVPWFVEEIDLEGKGRRVPLNHPYQQLMDRPNRFWSRQTYIELVVMSLYLAGNSITNKVRLGTGQNGEVKELWWIPPDNVNVVPADPGYIAHYEQTRDGGVVARAPVDDVIHHMFVDPSCTYWGMAPLQPGGRAVDTDVEAANWNKAALQNRAVADGAWVSDNWMSDEQYDVTKGQIARQHQGSKNARVPFVVGGSMKWQQMALTPVDMDYLDSRKLNREEICAVFGVPPVLVGILDRATYANIDTARRIFWENTMVPLLDDLRDTFNIQLTPDFENGQRLRLVYDLKKVPAMVDVFNRKVDVGKKLFDMGYAPNVINAELDLGLPEFTGGDTGYISGQLVPVGVSSGLDDTEE
jgi:HK97 family phage portal protein